LAKYVWNYGDEFEDNASTVKKSYWMYMEGAVLEVPVALKQHLKKGDRIAFVRDAFGSDMKNQLRRSLCVTTNKYERRNKYGIEE
jgi:hypothetical protein